MTKGSYISTNMYFFGPESIGNDTRSAPEGEYKVFCHFYILIGKQEPVILRRMFRARTKNRHSKWEVIMTKILCILPLGWVKVVFLLLLCIFLHMYRGNICQF